MVKNSESETNVVPCQTSLTKVMGEDESHAQSVNGEKERSTTSMCRRDVIKSDREVNMLLLPA